MTRFSLPRRHALTGAAALIAGTSLLPARAASGGPWAVELFTSQGCSSCPPADKNLGLLMARPDIVALSFHVDYWDYIGWKDPFASRQTTERQRAYARMLQQRSVYTPEMVFDGRVHDPGYSLSEVDGLLDTVQRRKAERATPKLARDARGVLTIALAAYKLEKTADITLAVYDKRHTTPVRRGENTGATLDNFNVVRRLETVAQWDGQPAALTVAADRFAPGQGVAVLVQVADHGPMLGCNKLEPVTAG
jgi:hypothetical protein